MSDPLSPDPGSADLRDKVVAPILSAFADATRNIFQIPRIQWAPLFAFSHEIDLVVQSWDGWLDHVRTEFEQFIQRDGKLNVFLHHLGSESEFEQLREANKKRIAKDRTEDRFDPLKEGICTVKRIQECISEALPNATAEERSERLRVWMMKELNWYSAMRFDETRLLLSLYAHNHHVKFEEPFFLIRTDVYPEIGRWFARELKYLRDKSELMTGSRLSELLSSDPSDPAVTRYE